jgi:PAS domain S-box-containing protein
MEPAVSASEVRIFRTLLESRVPIAIFSWRNEEGWPVEFVSPNVEHVLGYTAEEFLTKRVVYAEIIHKDDLARVTEEVAKGGASADRVFEHEDYRIVDPHREVRWVRDNTAVVRDDSGRITHFIGYIVDSTTRHEALEAIELARREAEAAARAKSEFLANVSHELRTPLALVLGPVEALLEGNAGPLSSEVVSSLERVQRNARRLDVLVNDLLDFAKLDAGREVVTWQSVDIARLVHALIEDVRSAAEARRLDLRFSVEGESSPIPADRMKLERIVLNLVGNALKFTPAGGRVDVTLRFASDEVELTVADTGPGIAAEEQERIFQRFEQGDASLRRKYEGAGLGLALVKAFSELMEGSVSVESELGKGSRFTVRIPRRADRLATTMAEGFRERGRRIVVGGEEPSREVVRTSRGGQPRVVVAEDNADMRAFIAEVLEDAYDVETVANGAAALAAIRARPPAVVVCDVMMPEVDGLEVVRTLKADPNYRSIPIILVTARAGREEVIGGLEAGADDYLPKPFDAMELRARVHAAERLHRAYLELQEAHERLVQAGKLAAVGTLTAGISHELNNPVATILLSTRRLLRDAPETSPLRDRLEVVERHAVRCQELVRALFELSEHKATGSERVRVDALLENIGRLARSQARSRDIVVDAELPTLEPMEVEANVPQIETAILNLVSNALDATPRGGRVSVSARCRDYDGCPGVEIAVSDTGMGISADLLPHVFDPFVTTKPGGHRTGLGLALAHRIVHDAGGHIEVETAAGRGTTMRVWLSSAGMHA